MYTMTATNRFNRIKTAIEGFRTAQEATEYFETYFGTEYDFELSRDDSDSLEVV